MALLQIEIFSENLQKWTQVYAIVPQRSTKGQIGAENNSHKGKFKTLYLLHGLSDDASIWERRTSIERFADKHSLAIIMPNADRSFYCNDKFGNNYYDYISSELPKIMEDMLPISEKKEDKYIAGISMGGYGALKIALKEQSFSGACILSPVGNIKKALAERWENLAKLIFGEEMRVPNEDDLLYLIKNCKNVPTFMAIGTNDFLYQDDIQLRMALEEHCDDFFYAEEQGTHEWGFWNKYIEIGLNWLLEKSACQKQGTMI